MWEKARSVQRGAMKALSKIIGAALLPSIGAAQGVEVQEIPERAYSTALISDNTEVTINKGWGWTSKSSCIPDESLRTDCCVSRVGAISVEFLYFKAIEDTLRYAEKIPQSPTAQPVYHSIEQEWAYDPGVRASLSFAIGPDWEIAGVWTYIRPTPPSVSDYDDFNSIFMSLDVPVFNSTGNTQAKYVQGGWRLKMNVWDLELRKPVYLCDSVMLLPVFGVKGCLLDQKMSVTYSQILQTVPLDETPQHVNAKNKVWGVGPEIGLSGKLLMPRLWSFCFRGALASLAGEFDLSTVYSQLLVASSGSTITINDKIFRLFSTWQLQVALSKKWDFDPGGLEIVLGWETQVWMRQNRWDFFSTLAHPPEGSDLTLYGPFAKVVFDF